MKNLFLIIFLIFISQKVFSQNILTFDKNELKDNGVYTQLLLHYNEDDETLSILVTKTFFNHWQRETLFREHNMECTGTFSKKFPSMIKEVNCRKEVENKNYVFLGFVLKLNNKKLYDAYEYRHDYSRVKPKLHSLAKDLKIKPQF